MWDNGRNQAVKRKRSGSVGELRLTLLGSPHLFVDGEDKILRERKAVALLAYLAVQRTVQSRDTLATLLWPEHDQQRARANLRYLLWSLRKTVGEGWLRADGDQIALTGAGKIRVDVEEFRQHLAAWRAHSHAADTYCAACVESLEAAEKLYRGDFLQGFTLDDSPQFDDWQFFQAEELRRSLAAGLEALVEQQIVQQNYESAIGHARRWLALNPLHEPACRALMKLYAWAGQHEAAIRQFHQCSLALQEEIGVEAEDETLQLYAQIRNRRFPFPSKRADEALPITPPTAPPATAIGNLPPVSTAFVGRQTELAQIAERLADPSARLLTIVGPGGIGKSTLAAQAGRAEEVHFPDGVWFVPLAGMESPAQVPFATLTALAAPPGAGVGARQQLLIHLRRQQCLLILDNFEDVLPAAEFVAELLHACPQVKVLVTSRERLNLREERLLALGNLSYPTDAKAAGAEQSEYSALRLFELCAQRIQPAFVLDATNLPSVIRICQLVDGMPLALEMAAAWARALPVTDIPGEIERSLSFLSTAARDVAERHRSIHAVFGHSWQLLTDRERSVLRQLAVFRNGFTREGAVAVAGASLLDLSALLDKSWIRLDSDRRYRMHALAQQYALEQLQGGTGERMADVLQHHAHFYTTLVPPHGRFSLEEGIVPAAEIENVKLAWQTALEQRSWAVLSQIAGAVFVMMDTWDSLGIAANLERTVARLEAHLQMLPPAEEEQRERIETALIGFLHMAGDYQGHLGDVRRAIAHLSKGRALLDRHREQSREAAIAYANITSTLGFAYYYAGQFATAEGHYREALAILDTLDETAKGVVARLYLLLVYIRLGRYPEAEDLIRAAEARPSTGGNWSQNQAFHRCLGWLLTRQGRYDEARQVLEESWRVTPPRYHSHALLFLGPAVRGQGNGKEAEEILRRGLALAEETEDRPAQTDLLAELGFTALQLWESEIAQDYFARSFACTEEIGRRHTASRALLGLGRVALQKRESATARAYLAQALAVAVQVNAPPDLLDVLVSVGELYAAEGKPAAAGELLDLAIRHPATTAETRSRALGLLQRLGAEPNTSEAQLPLDIARLRLEGAAQDTLAELENRPLRLPG